MLLVFMPLIPVKAVIKELIRHINEKSVELQYMILGKSNKDQNEKKS